MDSVAHYFPTGLRDWLPPSRQLYSAIGLCILGTEIPCKTSWCEANDAGHTHVLPHSRSARAPSWAKPLLYQNPWSAQTALSPTLYTDDHAGPHDVHALEDWHGTWKPSGCREKSSAKGQGSIVRFHVNLPRCSCLLVTGLYGSLWVLARAFSIGIWHRLVSPPISSSLLSGARAQATWTVQLGTDHVKCLKGQVFFKAF